MWQLESFRNCDEGFSIIFSKILATIQIFTKVIIFLIPLCIAFSVPKILGCLSLRKVA